MLIHNNITASLKPRPARHIIAEASAVKLPSAPRWRRVHLNVSHQAVATMPSRVPAEAFFSHASISNGLHGPHADKQFTCFAASKQAVSDLPVNLRQLVQAFQFVPDPKARYKQLLFLAGKLPRMAENLKVPENKVEGCVSQVWLSMEIKSDGLVYWHADSDSQLTKGLAALLVQGLSGCRPAEVALLRPDFIELLGLRQSLTPSRNNGFVNMLRLMQRKAREALAREQADADGANEKGKGRRSDGGVEATQGA